MIDRFGRTTAKQRLVMPRAVKDSMTLSTDRVALRQSPRHVPKEVHLPPTLARWQVGKCDNGSLRA